MKTKYGKTTTCILMVSVFSALWIALALIYPARADTVGRETISDLKFFYFYELSGSAPYVRFVNKNTVQVYDDTDTTDYLSSTTTWTDTDVALTTRMTTIGGWQLVVPATLPDGTYDILLYDVSTAAGARANTDGISRGKHAFVKGGQIVQISDI